MNSRLESSLDDGHRPERPIFRKNICEVKGMITVPKGWYESFRRAIMADFNQMGITVDQLMNIVKQNVIPDDGEAYQVTYVNKPSGHLVEVSIEKIVPAEGAENQVVATFNIGHAIMQTDQGAFSLEEYWVNVTTYPPGEINA